MNKIHKFVPIARHLPLITCDCGAQILLLPDLHAINLEIKAHATEHIKKGKTLKER